MLLGNKVAVIYGGGVISEAVATAFAREGARVFLAGRNQARLAAVAGAVEAAGGRAGTAVLDALDERRSASTPTRSPRRPARSTSP